MFTGLIQSVGAVSALQKRDADLRLEIIAGDLPFNEITLGESMGVNGVCLTVTDLLAQGFAVDVSAETLRCTTLHTLKSGSRLNLERCVTPNTLLGGHLVSGHVDGVGELIARKPEGASVVMRFKAPDDLARYIARKGSITVDGVSLTVNSIEGAQFELNLIPHTLRHTIIGDYCVGQRVNLEVDLIARYCERLLEARTQV